MKKIVKLCTIIVSLLLILLPVHIKGQDSRIVDECGILRSDEINSLSDMLDEISERQQCDLVCVIVPSLDGKDIQAFADDYFDYHNYGYGPNRDGIILIVKWAEYDGELKMSTSGNAIQYFTDYGLDNVLMPILEQNMRANPAKAISLWADQCDYMIYEAKKGNPIDVHYEKVELYVCNEEGKPVNGTFDVYAEITNSWGSESHYWDYIVLNDGYGSVYVEADQKYYFSCYAIDKGYDEPEYVYFTSNQPVVRITVQKSKYNFLGNSIFAGIAGLITSLIGTGIQKGKNKSVFSKNTAGEYKVNGSFRLHDAREYYLYSQTSRTSRASTSSSSDSGSYHTSHHSSSGGSTTHHSSSGSVHGGSRTGHF